MENNYFDRQDRVLKAGTRDIIQKTKIGIIGLGALGQSVAENLGLMGFRRFVLVDFDRIEPSNLSRSTLFRKDDVGKPKAEVAAHRLREIALADDLEIEYINGNLMEDVGKGLFWDCDIFVSALDTRKGRAHINDWCVRAGKPFYEGGFTDYQINISGFAPVGNTYPVCLRDQIGEGDFDGKRNSCSGLKVLDTELKIVPTIQFTAAMAGALIAKEIVLFLENRSKVIGKTLFFWGLNNESFDMIITPKDNLKIREEAFMKVIPVKVRPNPTVAQTVKAIETALGQPVTVRLPDTFVISGHCCCCGKEMIINRRKSKLYDHERWCEDCRKEENYQDHLNYNNEWITITEVSSSAAPEILQSNLRDIGVPANDVLEVMTFENDDFNEHHVRLMECKPQIKISEPQPFQPFNLADEPVAYYKGVTNADDDIKSLETVKQFFSDQNLQIETGTSDVACYLSQQALDEFIAHATAVYNKKGHEAIGVITGYYCQSADHPEQKMAIGTHFIPAGGESTQVTCEISLNDSIRIMDYNQLHKTFTICWIHSHPGFGAFYSGTDKDTLLTQYNAPFQFGVVVDILNQQSKAFKSIDGKMKEIEYYIFNSESQADAENNGEETSKNADKDTDKDAGEEGKPRQITLLNGKIIINLSTKKE